MTTDAPDQLSNGANAAGAQLELRVWIRLLTNANIVLNQLRRSLRDEFGVTMPAFDLLAQVHRPPQGPTMGQLSQRLMVSKGNVTDLVERMEEKGLLERRPDPDDGRVQHVHLTPAGEELVARMLPAHQAWLAEMMTGMDPAELHQLDKLLTTLKTTLIANTKAKKPRRPRPNDDTPARTETHR